MPIKMIIYDIDGVLMLDGQLIDDVRETIDKLHDMGIKQIAFTNNSTKHPSTLKSKFFQLRLNIDDIITSSILMVNYCKKVGIDAVYIVGEPGMVDYFRQEGIVVSQDYAKAVIVGMDRTLTYEKLAIATRLIRNGAKFLATNPDKTFPTPRGLEPGAGSMIASIVASTDKEPEIIVGKPNKYGFEYILGKYAMDPSNVIMVGDRYETDIIGALNAKIKGIIVKTGVAATRKKPENIITIETLSEIITIINGANQS